MSNSQLPIETLGATIKAHVAAGDKATEKAEQQYKAAGIHWRKPRSAWCALVDGI